MSPNKILADIQDDSIEGKKSPFAVIDDIRLIQYH